jgi:hypothetical protein
MASAATAVESVPSEIIEHWASNTTLLFSSAAVAAGAGDPLRALMLGAGTLSRGTPGSGEVFAALKSR